jgi:hypothetical protein
MKLLWLDDSRNPMADDWLVFSPIQKNEISEVGWVKSYKEFVAWIKENGLPDGICFDHDLADISYNPETQQETVIWHEKTGFDCCKWLVEYCMENGKNLPLYNIQSANTVGRENIDSYLKSYIKFNEKASL